MTAALAVDALLAASLVALALRVVTGRELFRDIVMFVVFGLVVALAWARAGAPDLALAEAAIGAGLTGALMLIAYRRIQARGAGRAAAEVDVAAVSVEADTAAVRGRRSLLSLPVAVLSGAMVAGVGLLALRLEPVLEGAGAAAWARLPETGLGNPVTGVLLVYRGIDTLLEMVVLLAAILGAWAVTAPGPPERVARVTRDTPLVAALLTLVVPLGLLIGVHLLLAGTDAPGGAFQAGAVLAGCGVLLVLTNVLAPVAVAGAFTRLLLVAGVAAFLLVGLGGRVAGGAFLAMPGLWAVYLVETAMLVSIAVTLTLLFARSGSLRPEVR